MPTFRTPVVAVAAAVATLSLNACATSKSDDSAAAASRVSRGSSASTPDGTTASPVPRDSAEGVWASPDLPLATWKASWIAHGGDPLKATEFLDGFGSRPQTSAGIVLKIQNGNWVLFQHSDGGPDTVGWAGTYTRDHDVVHAVGEACRIDYRIEESDGSLAVAVLSDGPASNPDCGPDDFTTQKAIFQTSPLHLQTS